MYKPYIIIFHRLTLFHMRLVSTMRLMIVLTYVEASYALRIALLHLGISLPGLWFATAYKEENGVLAKVKLVLRCAQGDGGKWHTRVAIGHRPRRPQFGAKGKLGTAGGKSRKRY